MQKIKKEPVYMIMLLPENDKAISYCYEWVKIGENGEEAHSTSLECKYASDQRLHTIFDTPYAFQKVKSHLPND